MSLKGVFFSIPARALTAAILAYRYGLSPLLPPRCRFAPTCSEYALMAVRQHGAGPGGWMAVKRIMKCHPWGGAGFDPVPDYAHTQARGDDGERPNSIVREA